MKIIIEPEAVNYIMEEGGFATIRYTQQGWCHSGTVDVAVIDLGKPERNPEGYETLIVEEISIFIPVKMVEGSPEVEISFSKLFKWKKLMLEKY